MSPNGTEEEHQIWLTKVYKVAIPVMIFFCVLSLFINIYILSLYHWLKKPLSSVLKLTMGLAGADAWASLIVGAGLIVNSLLPTLGVILPHGSCINLVLEAFRLASIWTSILHLLMLAMIHYLAIAYPCGSMRISSKVIVACLSLSWVLPPVVFLVYFGSQAEQGFQSTTCSIQFTSRLTFRLVIFMILLIPLLIMASLYARMISALNRQERVQKIRFGRKSNLSLQMKWKTMQTISLMIGSFLFGWFPGGLFFVLTAVDIKGLKSFRQNIPLLLGIGICVNCCMICKCCLNPLIYALRVKEIQEAMCHFLHDVTGHKLVLGAHTANDSQYHVASLNAQKKCKTGTPSTLYASLHGRNTEAVISSTIPSGKPVSPTI